MSAYRLRRGINLSWQNKDFQRSMGRCSSEAFILVQLN